jgi:D-alanine-D-alanine ligase
MKKNIAVVMGGYSKEVTISLNSGNVVANNLDSSKYNIFPVHILADKWVVVLKNKEFTINKSDFSATIDNHKIIFDVVFNAIHGNPGENGSFLAYLELLGIKHTSAPFYQMALTFNKHDTISVLRQFGIKAAKSIHLNKTDTIDINFIANEIKLPCFVKANNAGSSFGVSKVYSKENLKKAIDFSFEEDDEVLIESFLEGTEVSVGVYKFNNEVKVLEMTEIVSENDFFDFEAKYLGKSQEITPARISKEEREKLHNVAIKIYKKLNMKGMTRSDFIFVNGEPHFIEINTVPGLATESILPQQIRAAGMTLAEFFSKAIESA